MRNRPPRNAPRRPNRQAGVYPLPVPALPDRKGAAGTARARHAFKFARDARDSSSPHSFARWCASRRAFLPIQSIFPRDKANTGIKKYNSLSADINFFY